LIRGVKDSFEYPKIMYLIDIIYNLVASGLGVQVLKQSYGTRSKFRYWAGTLSVIQMPLAER
jgi:hypothetical protein